MKNVFDLYEEKALCPLCSSNEKTRLVEYKSEASLKHLLINTDHKEYSFLKNQIIENWKDDKCDFVECCNCHFQYAVPFVGGSNELYSAFYNSPDPNPQLNWEHKLVTDLIVKKYGEKELSKLKLLEFGPGDGGFMKNVIQKGFDPKNITGIESSESCIKALNAFGVSCLSSDLSSIDLQPIKKSVDTIVMFQVLEHLSDLEKTFRFINEISRENASLFIAVPNSYVRRYYELHGIFIDVPPIHISRWSKENFQLLGDKFGWKMQGFQFETTSFKNSAYQFLYDKGFKKDYNKIKSKITSKVIRWPILGAMISFLFLKNSRSILKINSEMNGTAELAQFQKLSSTK